MQELIQKRFDIKKEILLYNEENKKILENLEKNKKEMNIKKGGEVINYEELYRIYQEGITLLGNGDNDLVIFFNVASKLKEEELKTEFERLKITNDKNKDSIINKMLEDLEIYNWKINSELIEKLKMEVQIKNNI